MLLLRIISLIGLVLSIYALYVEFRASNDPNYVAACDISSYISCSKVFTSKFAHLFYLPNAVFGCGFYILIIILDYMKQYKLITVLGIISCVASAYLAYVLINILHEICVVCFSTYVVNICIVLISKSFISTKSSGEMKKKH